MADVYLQAAYADFLLDRGRAAEVLALLKDGARADVLAAAPGAGRQGQRRCARRRLDARPRGALRTPHVRAATARTKRRRARFALELLGDAPRALALARSNYAVQREPADARILLEAAIAARQPEAAAPVLRWLRTHRVQSAVLQRTGRAAGRRLVMRPFAVCLLALAGLLPAAQAHKPSDSYLSIRVDGGCGSRANGTSRCATWTSRSAWTPTATATSPGARCARAMPTSPPMRWRGWRCAADGAACAVEPGAQQVDSHTDGAYTVLPLAIRLRRARRRNWRSTTRCSPTSTRSTAAC